MHRPVPWKENLLSGSIFADISNQVESNSISLYEIAFDGSSQHVYNEW